MKKFTLSILAVLLSTVCSFAQFSNDFLTDDTLPNIFSRDVYGLNVRTDVVYQQGYTRNDGTYVEGHYKTKANDTNWDNFSTSGNLNLYTGEIGSVARDYSEDAYNYGSSQTIYTGPRGGQYYINSNGNKTYLPKRKQNSLLW